MLSGNLKSPSFLMNQIKNSPITIPAHITKPHHQLSGHVFGEGKNLFGILKDGHTSRLLKPLIDIRGKREYEFYLTVWNSDDVKLQSFVPKFYGLITIDEIRFIELEDATEGLINPSNMDVKLGIITYDPDADCQKIKAETSKNPYQKVLGFRICGIRIHNPGTNEFIHLDKHITRKLEPEKIPDAIDLFLGSQFVSKSIREQLVDSYLIKLRSLREWFITSNINHRKFLSSSLLFVHSVTFSSPSPCPPSITTRLKMIDFAHVFPNNPSQPGEQLLDDNYIYGLDKLIHNLEIVQDLLGQQINPPIIDG